ncbi:MAG: putative metal-binding motif-containing protein [Polyangiaceae bacterium]
MKRWLAIAILVGLLPTAGCGDDSVASPFTRDAGGDAADAGDAGDAEVAEDPDLGGPCVDDGQCDDAVPCTFDRCDASLGRCRNTADDSQCQDGVYCDGLEVCDRQLGCVEGEPVSCSDKDTCTIDACDEVSLTCSHVARDADSDGDPDQNCGGKDCNDTDPSVAGTLPEICGNELDDNCNGQVDEAACEQVKNDDCGDAQDMLMSGTYAFSTAGAARDHSATCSRVDTVDVVGAIVVPGSEPLDVDVIGRSQSPLELALAGQCGDASTELGCDASVPTQTGESVSRLWLRSLAPGAYPLYVFAPSAATQEVSLNFRPASSAPTNETCGSAQDVALGAHVVAQVVGVTQDLESRCSVAVGELVYHFSLSQTRDVRVFATSVDGVGQPSLSLRDAGCIGFGAELTCQTSPAVSLFARALPAGDYFLAVAATAPTEVDFVIEDAPPSAAPPDEDCSSPQSLTPGVGQPLDFTDHVDDVSLSCLTGAVDAVYALELAEQSDVLLVQRLSAGDTGAVGLTEDAAGSCGAELACQRADTSPLRLRKHALAAGTLDVVAESATASPAEITAFVRPASPTTLVSFADTCAQAIQIPAEGGFFQGNTANATADYDAGCDYGVQPPGGGADQMLKLSLSAPKRVIFDMQGSSYATLLNVRKGPACPGSELPQACSVGYSEGRSYLDLQLDAGDYFVQVDGYNRASGPWFLDVFVSDP